LLYLLRLSIRVEFAEQPSPVFFGRFGEMGDEGLDEIATGFLESFGAAKVGRVGLHERRIEVMLADQKAELIA